MRSGCGGQGEAGNRLERPDGGPGAGGRLRVGRRACRVWGRLSGIVRCTFGACDSEPDVSGRGTNCSHTWTRLRGPRGDRRRLRPRGPRGGRRVPGALPPGEPRGRGASASRCRSGRRGLRVERASSCRKRGRRGRAAGRRAGRVRREGEADAQGPGDSAASRWGCISVGRGAQ